MPSNLYARKTKNPLYPVPSGPSVQFPEHVAGPSNYAPHTLASLTAAEKVVSKSKMSSAGRKRDVRAQMLAVFGDFENARSSGDIFQRVLAHTISPSTCANHAAWKRLWLDYHEGLLGSKEAAIATLAPGGQFPPAKDFSLFLHFMAVTGKSNLGRAEITGWNRSSLFKNLFMIYGM
ncbi:hypothetical protein H0H92_014729, partial [Tricholoma furcatifolium]